MTTARFSIFIVSDGFDVKDRYGNARAKFPTLQATMKYLESRPAALGSKAVIYGADGKPKLEVEIVR